MSLADYQLIVERMVRDQSGTISTQDRARAIATALARYSDDCARRLVADVEWPASGHFGPLPASWNEDSYLVSVEHPIDQLPTALVNAAVAFGPEGTRMVVREGLQTGAIVRVTFAAPHVLAAEPHGEDTVPDRHREAVASYAAHVLCLQLATYYAGEIQTSVGADGSNTDSRSRNYRTAAASWRSAYYAGIGKADPQARTGSGAGGGAVSDAALATSSWARRPRAGLVTYGGQE